MRREDEKNKFCSKKKREPGTSLRRIRHICETTGFESPIFHDLYGTPYFGLKHPGIRSVLTTNISLLVYQCGYGDHHKKRDEAVGLIVEVLHALLNLHEVLSKTCESQHEISEDHGPDWRGGGWDSTLVTREKEGREECKPS